MQLSRRVLDAYNAAVKRQGGNAENAARKTLEAWLAENPDASVADAREFAIQLMAELGALFGKAAGDAAFALRGIVAEAAGVELPDVGYWYEPAAEFVGKAAHYQAGKLDVGDVGGFVDGIAASSRYFAERGANDTMAAFAEADVRKLGKKVRFARVPTGPTNCPYCLMLASRGFVYGSEAKALNGNHPHCDCRIVEGFDGMTVEGYDPDEYYDRWKHPEIYEGLDEETSESLSCLRIAEQRGQVAYDKPLLSFLETEDGRRDLFAHAALARDGRRFRALAEDAPDGFSNIDLEMDGEKWEVKSPPGDNPRAVESNLRKAKKQARKNYPEPLSETRVVFNGRFYGQDDAWVSEELGYQMSEHGVAEALHVREDGSVRQIEKAQTPYSERPGLRTGSSIAYAAGPTEGRRSPKPETEVRPLGGVPGDTRPSEIEQRIKTLEHEMFSRQNGAVSGAVRGDRKKEQEHAESYYDQVRNRDRKGVLERLGRESGLTENEIEKAFSHLLIEEHDLDDGIHRFYPDYEMSQSMQRLLEGKSIQDHDRIMFAHEYWESVYMSRGFDQRAAHVMANEKYNYEEALNDWLDAGAIVKNA